MPSVNRFAKCVFNKHYLYDRDKQQPSVLCFRLELATGLDLQQKLCKSLDICRFTKKIRRGTLGEGTTRQIQKTLEKMLRSEGIPWLEAQSIVKYNWEDCDPVKPTDHLRHTKDIFMELKSSGIKIALHSADDRKRTIENLRRSELMSMIDHVSCGNDEVIPGVGEICDSVGVSRQNTIVIGDAVADMWRGREAGVAVNVGVLSGVSSRLNLARLADVVVDDVGEAVNYVRTLNDDAIESLRQRRRGRSVREVDDRQASVVIFDKDGTLLCFHSLWTPWADEMINRFVFLSVLVCRYLTSVNWKSDIPWHYVSGLEQSSDRLYRALYVYMYTCNYCRLEAATDLDLAGKIFKEFGYCTTERKWRPALFAEGTNQQCMEKVAEILEEEGIERLSHTHTHTHTCTHTRAHAHTHETCNAASV